MIDLGFVQLPLEAINVLVIMTALMLAVNYIGFDVIGAIGGVLAIVFGVRIALYEYEVFVAGYMLGIYEACLLMIVGAFLIYRGTESFFYGRDINTWK